MGPSNQVAPQTTIQRVIMGYYIQGPLKGKADFLKEAFNAIEVSIFDAKKEIESTIDSGKCVICVVENSIFDDVAGLVYDIRGFNCFNNPDDIRPKKWLLMDKEKAHKLAGYTE
jgi:hypothetical protein